MSATLWLVPAPLDFGIESDRPLDELLPLATVRRASQLQDWAVENARTARAFLKRVNAVTTLATAVQGQQILELPRAGRDLGLLSEAGLPAVADPGARLVALAHAEGFAVRSLPGSSSLTQALAASGLHGQCFAFQGYLPQDATQRAARIRELESLSRKLGQTQQVIETPYRNVALLAALLTSLQPSTRLAVSLSLTTEREWTRSATVSAWRAAPATLPNDQPAIYSWLAG